MGWKLPTLTAVLWVIALTVLSVALGVLIAGPLGVVIGAIPLALGTVVAGFVPAIRDAALRRRAEQRAAEAALERWDAVGEPTAEAVHRGPAALLRPDSAIVDFTGRDSELALLRAWCASQDAHSVRIIVGAGGVGKTRLALAVADEWEACGHEWRRVDAGHEAEAVAAARAVTSGSVLLLVDYAETRADLEGMLRVVLADPGPIRVLLVARSLGEWWDRLKEKSAYAIGRLLGEAEPIILAEQVSQEISSTRLVADAVPQFARALGCAGPAPVRLDLPAHPVPILVLHTAALIAVLRFRDDPARSMSVVVAEGLLDELLEHESRYWRRKAAAADLPEDGALLKPVTAVAALLGADDLADAAEIITRIPDLSDTTQAQRRSWARWLYELYPADPEGRLGSLQPDLLAETHVVNQLSAAPELARAFLTNLPGPKAEHALTVLVRASAHHEAAHRLIADSLREDLAHLALPAALVALQSPDAVAALLTAALQTAPAPLDLLIRIADALPYPSVVLAQAQLAVTWRVLNSLPSDADRAIVAEWSNKTGLMLAQLGHSAEALSVTEEAVAIYRDLADANPDVHRPVLARALSALGVRLYDQGQASEAISVTEEAVAIGQELADANPDRHRPDFAASLSNLGVRLWALGRSAEALPIAEAAADAFRELADANPERYSCYLATTLTNLGIWRSALGRSADALPPIEEGADIYRGLADADPDRYGPELAQILVNLGLTLAEVAGCAAAVPVMEEAVTMYRELADANPDRYRPGLAAALANLGPRLAELGRFADAVPVMEEAVSVHRMLADVNPDRYRADLAASLANLGGGLSEIDRSDDALSLSDEAVAIFRDLADSNPDRHRADLAASLSNLGLRLLETGRATDALPAADEGTAIHRDLAAADPNRYSAALARSLYNQAAILTALNRHLDAEQVREVADKLKTRS